MPGAGSCGLGRMTAVFAVFEPPLHAAQQQHSETSGPTTPETVVVCGNQAGRAVGSNEPQEGYYLG